MDACGAGSAPAQAPRRITSDLDVRRTAPKEATLDTLSPREIQSRLRSGATIAELVEESGMDASAIERFSGPPLAERAYISEQARACVVRPGTEELEILVTRDLDGGPAQALAWDAWRRPDGRWTVVASADDSTPLSTWVFDPRSRSVQPDDAASHRLASQDVVVPLRSSTSTTTLPRTETPRTDTSAPTPADDHGDSDDVATSPTPASAAVDGDAGQAADEQSAAPEPEPATARPKSRKGRRASVPRWDEILFGAGQSDS